MTIIDLKYSPCRKFLAFWLFSWLVDLVHCWSLVARIQYIPRNMHTVTALLCFVVVKHWLIFPYPSGLLHWHCGNLTIAPVPAKQPWWIWINTSCEFIMNDCITTTKQSTTKPCAYFLGYTVCSASATTHVWNAPLSCKETHADTFPQFYCPGIARAFSDGFIFASSL